MSAAAVPAGWSKQQLFKPKVPRSQLEASARVIQIIARRRLRARLVAAFDEGKVKLYEQKYNRHALNGAASLIAAHARGRHTRQSAEDAKEEAEVDEYLKQKRAKAAQQQFHFKPAYPASYYRGAAAFIQRQARESGWARPLNAAPEPVKPVYRPLVPNSRLRKAVITIQAIGRGEHARRIHGRVVTSPSNSPPATRARPLAASAADDGGGSKSRIQLQREAEAAALQQVASTAQRQQQAEDAFLEADTDGSGSIDEDECLALFEKLTSNQQADVLAEYMRSFRTSPDTPLDLEFDQFVHVYNSFLEKWGQ